MCDSSLFEEMVFELELSWLKDSFGLGRNTIRRIIRQNQQERQEGHDQLTRGPQRLVQSGKLTPFLPLMIQLLNQYPRITGERMYEELRLAGYAGGRTILQEKLRHLRPKPKTAPVIRFETAPGLQGQMDWSVYTVDLVQGGKTQVFCFSYVLGFSRRQYLDFTLRRDFFTLIRRHQDAFEHFGGVPRECLYDNEKTVVLRWEGGQRIYNPAFINFITHYRCRPVICRPGRPQTKGKVEAPFQYVEKNFLNARHFNDLADLRVKARWWLLEKADQHLHQTTGRRPLDLFLAQEKDQLLPLPVKPYDASEIALRVCSLDGFIDFQTNRYSVPFQFVAEIVTLKASEQEILIYGPDLTLIAQHERLPAGQKRWVENPEHRVSPRLRYGLSPVVEAFLALGTEASAFLEGLKGKHPRHCGFQARAILRLKEKYTPEDIDLAMAHARRFGAFDARAVERILAARAKPRTLESLTLKQAGQTLVQALPQIKQRPLEEYAPLLKPQNVQKENQDGDDTGENQDLLEFPELTTDGSSPGPGTG